MTETDQPADHVARNRAAWNEWAADFVAPGESNWATDEPNWGIWGIPETELHVFPDELAGLDAIELGCGTAYVSAWLARRGARPVGIDLSREQLATARRLQEQHGLTFPLHEGNAEHLPFADESFDLAISEYGACLWADPRLWVPEAARVLRPGGRLIFLTNGTILMLCAPDADDELPTDRLVRDYFGMHRFEWPGASRGRVPPGLRRLDPAAARQWVRGRGPARGAAGGRRRADPALRRHRRASSGRGAGRARRSGRRASAPERCRSDRRLRTSAAVVFRLPSSCLRRRRATRVECAASPAGHADKELTLRGGLERDAQRHDDPVPRRCRRLARRLTRPSPGRPGADARRGSGAAGLDAVGAATRRRARHGCRLPRFHERRLSGDRPPGAAPGGRGRRRRDVAGLALRGRLCRQRLRRHARRHVRPHGARPVAGSRPGRGRLGRRCLGSRRPAPSASRRIAPRRRAADRRGAPAGRGRGHRLLARHRLV